MNAKIYSGGIRRRLELAQVLVHSPRVLFLDEPTVSLDVAARKKTWKHISTLHNAGMSILITTQYMDKADCYCDRVAIVDKGIIRAVDTPAQLKSLISHDVVTVNLEGNYSEISIPGVHFAGKEGDIFIFHTKDGALAIPGIKD